MTLEELLIPYNEVIPDENYTSQQTIPSFFELTNVSTPIVQNPSQEPVQENKPLWYFADYAGMKKIPGITPKSTNTSTVQSKVEQGPVKPQQETSIKQSVKKYTKGSKNDNITTALDYFVSKGLSMEQSAGIVGNLLAESNLDPKAINKAEKKKGYKGYGRGIAQWSNERVANFKNVTGKEIERASLTEQLDFVWHELQERKILMSKLKNAKSTRESADLILRGYENGNINGLVTPEQMYRTYSRAYQKLDLGPYSFEKMLSGRVSKADEALKHYVS